MKSLVLPAAWIGAAVGALLAIDAPAARSSYCPECGIRRDERQFRFAGYTLPVSAPTQESPSHLSELLRTAGVDRPHRHRFRPTTCPVLRTDITSPIGRAILKEVGTPRVLAFVRELETFADPATVARWHAYLGNAEFLRMLDDRLRFLRFPSEGYDLRPDFMKWWTNNAASLYREIEITPMICC